jgi:long-chain acyl-CoA synthetase
MVAGDRRPHLVGLIVPDPEWAREWAAAEGIPYNPAALRDDSRFLHALMAAVDRVNANLSVIEKVRRILIADEPFTIENEQLTPSLKVRRHVLRARYGERLGALYRR